MTDVVSTDPRTGTAIEVVGRHTTAEEVDRSVRAAASATSALEGMGRGGRARLLRTMADGLEARREDVVATADRETAIGPTRLSGELTRTCYQLRLFAEVLDEGSYIEATIDHPGDTPMGPRPDIRRMLVPVGPVAVFGASNFPLAFSVPGGDTASALAAGSPIVLKAHESHPATAQLCFDVLTEATASVGAPAGVLNIVHGRQAGAELVAHPGIQAVGFTGSLSGGQALMKIIERREQPIPFYGEMSSLNPVVVSAVAATERGEEIGKGLVTSYTVAGGQLCTKPGLVLLPTGDGGDGVVAAMVDALAGVDSPVLLNQGISSSFRERTAKLRERQEIDVLYAGPQGDPSPAQACDVAPLLVQVRSSKAIGSVVEEYFGPATVVMRYSDLGDLRSAIDSLPSSLTATIHSASAESEEVAALTALLRDKAGRIVYDGYPTGVSVTWAQHHGGPWPSTNTLFTSVGPTAIRRFLRPVAFQDAPASVLPEELREDIDPTVPRRIDGHLVVPAEGTV